MKKNWIIIMIAIAGLSLVSIDAKPTWEGVYVVNGVNPDKSTYQGHAQVVPWGDAKGLYSVVWQFGKGDQAQQIRGFAFEDGDQLIVAGLEEPMPVRVKRNGDVRWSAPGAPSVGSEKWTHTELKKLPLIATPAVIVLRSGGGALSATRIFNYYSWPNSFLTLKDI